MTLLCGVLAEKRGLADKSQRQHPRIILWHMAAREKLLAACTERFPESTTLALDFKYIKARGSPIFRIYTVYFRYHVGESALALLIDALVEKPKLCSPKTP